jgi:hypothetical protein
MIRPLLTAGDVAALLNIINDRRRMLRLRPFVQAAAPAAEGG